MNIVARVHLYPPCHNAGAEMMLHELLKALVQRGHRVQVHLSRFGKLRQPYVREGVEIFPRGTADWQAEAAKADALITHLDNTSTVISAAIAYDKPLIQVLHNTHAPTRVWANCRNDLLVCNSDWMYEEFGEPHTGIVVRPPVFRSDYEVDYPGLGYAVTLVNLNQAKGGLIFSQLATLMPNTEFIGVEGAYGEQLLPNLPNVELRPHGTDMRQVYQATKLLLMPSSYESYGRVGVEAACSGIPTIATDTPGLREALGDSGFFMPPDSNVYAWKFTVENILHGGIYDSLSAAARAQARNADLLSIAELNTFCHRVEALT